MVNINARRFLGVSTWIAPPCCISKIDADPVALAADAGEPSDTARLVERERGTPAPRTGNKYRQRHHAGVAPARLPRIQHLAVTGFNLPACLSGEIILMFVRLGEAAPRFSSPTFPAKGSGRVLNTMLQGELSGMTLGTDPIDSSLM